MLSPSAFPRDGHQAELHEEGLWEPQTQAEPRGVPGAREAQEGLPGERSATPLSVDWDRGSPPLSGRWAEGPCSWRCGGSPTNAGGTPRAEQTAQGTEGLRGARTQAGLAGRGGDAASGYGGATGHASPGCWGAAPPGLEFARRQRRERGDSSLVGRRTGARGDSGRWCCLGPGRLCRGQGALSPGTQLPAGLEPVRGAFPPLLLCLHTPFPPWATHWVSPPARASPHSLPWSRIALQSPASELSAVGTKGLGAGVCGV